MSVSEKTLESFNGDIESASRFFKDKIFQSGAFSNVEFIGVAGSIGRGEKSIFDKNLNDIDFVVVGELSCSEKKSELESLLCEVSFTNYTDVAILRPKLLWKQKNRVHQYIFDFIHGHMALYQTVSFSKKILKLQSETSHVTSQSILNLYLTRSFCAEVKPEVNSGFSDFFIRYQYKKIVFAYIDSALIASDSYHTLSNKEKFLCFSHIESNSYFDKTEIANALHEWDEIELYDLHKFTLDVYKAHRQIIFDKCKLNMFFMIVKCVLMPSVDRRCLLTKLIRLAVLGRV